MRRRLTPIFQQGGLDGLCGAYAVVNSLTWLLQNGEAIPPLKLVAPRDESDMFAAILAQLSKRQIIDTVRNGSRFPLLKRFTRSGIRYIAEHYGVRMRMSIPFAAGARSMTELWDTVHEHSLVNGPGSVLIGLEGIHWHWTSVKTVHQRSLVLCDSGGLARINRSRATIGKPSRVRPHRIVPEEMILLSIR